MGVGGCQPPLLTLKNGSPGAFNNPCASHKEGGEEMRSYPSPSPRPSVSQAVLQLPEQLDQSFSSWRFLDQQVPVPSHHEHTKLLCVQALICRLRRLLLCGFWVIPGIIRSEFDLLHLVLLWR